MPRNLVLSKDGHYKAIAQYVSEVQQDLPPGEGVIVEEIVRDLGIPRATVYRKLKLPGFYKTPRPINPRGFAYDPKLIANELTKTRDMQSFVRQAGFSPEHHYDLQVGRVTLKATNPSGLSGASVIIQLLDSAASLPSRLENAIDAVNAMSVRSQRFSGGDASALDPAADLLGLRDFAALVSACRTISEVGQSILNDPVLSEPDYWKVFNNA